MCLLSIPIHFLYTFSILIFFSKTTVLVEQTVVVFLQNCDWLNIKKNPSLLKTTGPIEVKFSRNHL